MEVGLYEPEIPPNTGNIGRLCVNAGAKLSIIGKPSFDLQEKSLRRAGLDYWKELDWELHENWESFLKKRQGQRIFLVSKFGRKNYAQVTYHIDDIFVFGRETSGLPDWVRNSHDPDRILMIPMVVGSRSINLSNAVAIVLYEALRQIYKWSENTLHENWNPVIL